MGKIAKQYGIHVIRGVAEQLPFKSKAFELALMVTTICFVDNLGKSFKEVYRILQEGGSLIVGFVDKNSPIGQIYLKHQHASAFYQEATFFSTQEVITEMTKNGFGDFDFRQTIFKPLAETDKMEPVENGYGEGSFVVIRGQKK
jgi:ubiquinone/menaquinone biosynthesis C-methylase UbiE